MTLGLDYGDIFKPDEQRRMNGKLEKVLVMTPASLVLISALGLSVSCGSSALINCLKFHRGLSAIKQMIRRVITPSHALTSERFRR